MSDIIRLLSDNVANQIAAGEVVQRPASVVKELLENSIDAGSSSILLIVKDGGRSLIQVVDDGSGMSEADARMCFERHATSKIAKAEDLQTIRTNGFRGEAMASIAAIAHVELKTRQEEDELGSEVIIEGTKINSQEPCACAKGTSISVRNLFYNVPARRQFLKSDAVEMKHVMDEFHRVALAHPSVAMELINNDNEVHKLPSSNPRQRIVHLLGKKYDERLVPLDEDTEVVKVSGFIGKPEFAKKTRGEQFFFVNERFIKSNYLNHSVSKAYEELIARDQYPSFFIFLDVDPATIDINIHPTKTEIKFRDERHIYAILNAAVRRALGRFNISPTIDFDQEASLQFGGGLGIGQSKKEAVEVSNWRPQTIPRTSIRNTWKDLFETRKEVVDHDMEQPQAMAPDEPQQLKADFHEQRPEEHKAFRLHGRYMVAKLRSGFMVVDIPRSRERIIYERSLRKLEAGSGSSQQILFPQNLDLNPSDFQLLMGYEEELLALGFMISDMGGNTVAVNGVPSEVSEASPEILLENILEQIKNETGQLKNSRHDGMARVMAQSMRVDSGLVMSNESMHELIDQLFACSMPYYTASGKPTLLTWDINELEDRFG